MGALLKSAECPSAWQLADSWGWSPSSQPFGPLWRICSLCAWRCGMRPPARTPREPPRVNRFLLNDGPHHPGVPRDTAPHAPESQPCSPAAPQRRKPHSRSTHRPAGQVAPRGTSSCKGQTELGHMLAWPLDRETRIRAAKPIRCAAGGQCCVYCDAYPHIQRATVPRAGRLGKLRSPLATRPQ